MIQSRSFISASFSDFISSYLSFKSINQLVKLPLSLITPSLSVVNSLSYLDAIMSPCRIWLNSACNVTFLFCEPKINIATSNDELAHDGNLVTLLFSIMYLNVNLFCFNGEALNDLSWRNTKGFDVKGSMWFFLFCSDGRWNIFILFTLWLLKWSGNYVRYVVYS